MQHVCLRPLNLSMLFILPPTSPCFSFFVSISFLFHARAANRKTPAQKKKSLFQLSPYSFLSARPSSLSRKFTCFFFFLLPLKPFMWRLSLLWRPSSSTPSLLPAQTQLTGGGGAAMTVACRPTNPSWSRVLPAQSGNCVRLSVLGFRVC